MKLSRKQKIIVVALTAVILGIAVYAALASTIIVAPEHEANNPIATPEPTPTPTPAPIAELHLSSNNTSPFYKGNTLHLVATLAPAQAGVPVTLYNNGVVITSVMTDSNGVAIFDRVCINPFDFTVSAELP